MTMDVGARLPAASFIEMGEAGPASVTLEQLTQGRRIVLFGLPGAYTGTCSTQHVPSFVRTASAFAEKGVDEIVCVSVNDPFVMKAWSESTGAGAAGIRMLADADASFTKAVGMAFTAPPVGLFDRSKRYAALVEDGVVKVLNVEESPGQCEVSAGETLLAAMEPA